jgi:hypothetical protein
MSTDPPAPDERRMPVGPWVLVVGMHRSGTSAVTGALAQLGLAAPFDEDRWEPSDDNPDHWESRALGLYDDLLLERLGGTWDRPPDPDWASSPELSFDESSDAAVAAAEAFPQDEPVVWKDPRVCLLLPYWLHHLPKPVAAVFIWRSPLAVARSLQARDGLHLADGVALWERYTRAGLAGLVGVDTFVTRYESIVEDPSGGIGDLAKWLADLPQFAPHSSGWDVDRAVASITPELLRQRASGDAELLLPEQVRLLAHLESLDGAHRPLAALALGPESPWTTAVLGDRHQLATLSGQRDALKEKVREQRYAAQALAAEMSARSEELDRARGQVADAEVEVDEAQAREAGAWAEVAEARRGEAEAQDKLAGALAMYERMKASTSWRITRPLRQVIALKNRKGTRPSS